jgi:hypothetical protein
MDCSVAGLGSVDGILRVARIPPRAARLDAMATYRPDGSGCLSEAPEAKVTAHVSVACGHGAAQDWRRIRGEANHAA